MKRSRYALPSVFCALLACGAVLAGCGRHNHTPKVGPTAGPCAGGGTASSVAPRTQSAARRTQSGTVQPESTFTPYPEHTPVLSRVVITSDPSALCAQVNGSKVGDTPTKFTPAFADSPYTFEVIPSNSAAPYVYVMDQTANGDKQLLYNQTADTQGSISTVSQSSVLRNLKSKMRHSVRTNVHKMPATWTGRPGFSTTRLEVRYRADKLQRGSGAAAIEKLEGVARARNIGFERDGLVTRILSVPAGDTVDALGARLKRHSEVYDTHPVSLRYRSSVNPVTPNDPDYDDPNNPSGAFIQWDFPQMAVNYAWGYTEGSSGIQVAIIDTGSDPGNNDLAGKIHYGESVLSGTITQGISAAQDTDGHGTNVSGIAAANTNNATAVAGVGFNTTLDAFKIFADGSDSASTDDEAQAIYDAVTQGARVINLSLGSAESNGWDSVERDAVEYAISHQVTVVAAAGNERTASPPFNPGVDYPAAYDGVISVGATSINDDVPSAPFEYVASYSNSGPQLSVVAPGGDPSSDSDPDPYHWILNLYTTDPWVASQTCSLESNCVAQYAGTSQATPHVTGTVALMLSKNPGLQPSQIKTILQATADNISDPNQGFGRVNAYRALAAVVGDSQGLPLPAFSNFVAFAYSNSGAIAPQILDVTFPQGVPVNQDGTFRIADIPSTASQSYRVAVWADLNGNGFVDAGDFFAASSLCSVAASCTSASGLVPTQVKPGFTLP